MANKKLPTLVLNEEIILPLSIKEVKLLEEVQYIAIDDAIKNHNNTLLVLQSSDLKSKGLLNGILVKIIKYNEKQGLNVLLEGIKRVTILKQEKDVNGIFSCEYKDTKEVGEKKVEIEEIRKLLTYAISKTNIFPVDAEEINLIKELDNSQFIDRISAISSLNEEELRKVIYNKNILERYLFIIKKFSTLTDKSLLENYESELKEDINNRVKDKVQNQQKEYYLREQIKAIQTELDDLTGNKNEFENYREKVNKNPYPKHIKKKVLSEVNKLELTSPQAQESNITRQYIDWLLDLPYWQEDEEVVDINKAKKILDKEHYGLKKPKDKIIEFLAVKQQNPNAKGSILALVGPPGTGKTTMAKSIASALNRKFIKISLGGVKDEAEIRGHRRTYIASNPGKIIQAMKKAGVNNPVILLDEIDKMSSDFKGDPTSAMLEVLDYEQNSMFQDHYIEEDYDLSKVTFIATANYYSHIPEPLIDRLDFVEISSYTEIEKIEIFKKHLLKRVKDETKIPANIFKWNVSSIKYLIRHYTIEAGVRQLYREASTIARKILVKKLSGDKIESPFTITPSIIQELLGPQKFDYTKIDKEPQTGTVTGLAWTQYGGDILPIEVSLYNGKGDIVITGQLKDVMQESAKIALSFIKANHKEFGIEDISILKDKDIHIHSPDGATPKDGPSAGVTFTTAIISAITGKKVSQYLGMTGEITLRGKVLPIGGLKEKSISAFRSGLKTIFIPKENIRDIIDIPKNVSNKLNIIPVQNYEEIYQQIFKK